MEGARKMKKQKILFLLPLLVLTACQSGNSKSIEEKIAVVQGNLKMTGTISYKFYDDNNQPTDGEPVTSALNVLFTDVGYYISYKGDFDQNFESTLFKSERNTVELRYINNLNELVIECPTDKENNEYDFTPYTNPFVLLNTENLIVADDKMSANINLDTALDTAIDFVSRLTYYSFPELAEVSISTDKEKVTGVHIATTVLKETLRSGVYSFDLQVEAIGEEVVGPVTPEPLKPNANQARLQSALEELMSNDYEATLKLDAYTFGLYKNKDGILCSDKDEPIYSIGYFKDNDQLCEVTYDKTSAAFVKSYSTELTEDDLVAPWLAFSTVLYDSSEDGKTFTLSSTIDSSYVGQFGFLLSLGNCMELYGATGMSLEIDDQNHLLSVTFVSEYEMFSSAVLTIDKIGSCTLPFDLATIAEKA